MNYIDSDDNDTVSEPKPTYTDKLIQEFDEDFEKVLEESIIDYNKNNNFLNSVIEESIIDYNKINENNDILDSVYQASIDSYLEELNKIKKERSSKLNNLMLQLKRVDKFENNNTIKTISKILENYINNLLIIYSVKKEEYNKIFNELKNLRILEETLNIVKSIIILDN